MQRKGGERAKGFAGTHDSSEREGIICPYEDGIEFLSLVENHGARHRGGVQELLLRRRANNFELADVDDRFAGYAPAVAGTST